MAKRGQRRSGGGFLGRLLGGIILLGVVIGLWQVLGQGANPTDPEFFGNATETLERVVSWFQRVADRLFPN